MDKSLGTLLHFWGVFQFTQLPNPPLNPQQSWIHISRIFFKFQLWIGWGGRTARQFQKGCIACEQALGQGGELGRVKAIFSPFPKTDTVSWGNSEMTEKYEYRITVPRTFVHDCSYTHECSEKSTFQQWDPKMIKNKGPEKRLFYASCT